MATETKETKSQWRKRTAARLRSEGFDQTYCKAGETTILPRCSQCQVLVIQGMATHETGCPNARLGSRRF